MMLAVIDAHRHDVSMKSGLEGRNNHEDSHGAREHSEPVSMKSGLEGRNNRLSGVMDPEELPVSMKSGLEGRNNLSKWESVHCKPFGLNEVRPRRPEQFGAVSSAYCWSSRSQ